MVKRNDLKKEVLSKIGAIEKSMIKLSSWIHDHPELSFQEFKAVHRLTSELDNHGFQIRTGLADLETSFKATYQKAGRSPVICLMAEYDALEGLGHACGHNLSGVASIAAGISLSKVMSKHKLDGTILVMGTPGEEMYSGKVKMVNVGVFENIDVAMMTHMSDRNVIKPKVIALDGLEFNFTGKSSHAALAPDKGINALNGVLQTFRNIDALRQHVRDGVRIHGIITKGGDAVNIVPEKATARFYVRFATREYLDEVTEKVKNCAQAASLATGAEVNILNYESSDDLKHNPTLSEVFKENLKQFCNDIEDETIGPWASTDVGNVSKVVPTIQPLIKAAPRGTPLHTKEFAKAAGSQIGHKGLLIAAKTLALTVIDLLTQPDLLEKIRDDFAKAFE